MNENFSTKTLLHTTIHQNKKQKRWKNVRSHQGTLAVIISATRHCSKRVRTVTACIVAFIYVTAKQGKPTVCGIEVGGNGERQLTNLHNPSNSA